MSPQLDSHPLRQQFLRDFAEVAQQRRIDLFGALRLTRSAHFSVHCAQDPKMELAYYRRRIGRLCQDKSVAPEAKRALAGFLEHGARPQTDDPFIHRAVAGETLAGLALRYGTTRHGIARANPRAGCLEPLAVGQRLLMPGNLSFVVQPGDTLTNIARSLDAYVRQFCAEASVTEEELMARNELWPGDSVRPGDVLAFPFPELA